MMDINIQNNLTIYNQQAKLDPGRSPAAPPPPPPPPQKPEVVSGSLTIDSTNKTAQSAGVSNAKKIESIQNYNPSQSYITLGTERALGLFTQKPQFQAVNEYNKFIISQYAYKK